MQSKNPAELKIGDIFHLKSAGTDVLTCYKAENIIGMGDDLYKIWARQCLRSGFVTSQSITDVITKEQVNVFGNDSSGLSPSAQHNLERLSR